MTETAGPNRSLARAASILDALERVGSLSISELARATGLSTSVVHRFTTDMTELGFLHRTESGVFDLGRRFRIDQAGRLARPILEALRDVSGETTQYWIRRANDRVCLASADSQQELRVTLPVGTVLPLARGGSAGNLLALLPDATASIRARGWVESEGRRTPGLTSVSAPVVVDGVLTGAICLAAPLVRLGDEGIGAQYGAAVIDAAKELGARISQY